MAEVDGDRNTGGYKPATISSFITPTLSLIEFCKMGRSVSSAPDMMEMMQFSTRGLNSDLIMHFRQLEFKDG